MWRWGSTALTLLSAAVAGACGPGLPQTEVPAELRELRVKVKRNRLEPYVFDWRAGDRAKLEAHIRRKGPAIVRFDEESFEFLSGCRVSSGEYEYVGVSPQQDSHSWTSLRELGVNVPLSAAKLSAELEAHGAISYSLYMVGQRELRDPQIVKTQLEGDCSGATHFVNSVTLGAFRFQTGHNTSAEGEAGVMGMGASGRAEDSEKVLNRAGDFGACKEAKVNAQDAPGQCSAIIQVEIVPLKAQPGTAVVVREKKDERVDCGPGMKWNGSSCIEEQRLQREARQAAQSGQAGPKLDGRRKGYVCDPQNAAECKQQCRVGNLESCTHLAIHMFQGTGGVASDPDRALKLLELACKGDHAPACREAGAYHHTKKDYRRALLLGSKACLAGDAAGCTNVGFMAFYGQGLKAQNRARAFTLWTRACKLGEKNACNNAGVIVLHGMGGVAAQPAKARQLFEIACNSPGKEGCVNLGHSFELGLGGPKDFKRALQLYDESCQAGQAMGCTFAGLLIEENSNRTDHLKKALEYHERGCGMQVGGGCLTREELESKLPGRYTPDGYDRRACDEGDRQALACYNAAIANERGYGGSTNLPKAGTQLKQACQLGMKKACREARPDTRRDAGQKPGIDMTKM